MSGRNATPSSTWKNQIFHGHLVSRRVPVECPLSPTWVEQARSHQYRPVWAVSARPGHVDGCKHLDGRKTKGLNCSQHQCGESVLRGCQGQIKRSTTTTSILQMKCAQSEKQERGVPALYKQSPPYLARKQNLRLRYGDNLSLPSQLSPHFSIALTPPRPMRLKQQKL